MTIALQEIASRGSLASFMQNHYEQLGHRPRYLLLLARICIYISHIAHQACIRHHEPVTMTKSAILAQKNFKFNEVVLKKEYILEDIKNGQ